jgi:hypothetical protein
LKGIIVVEVYSVTEDEIYMEKEIVLKAVLDVGVSFQ